MDDVKERLEETSKICLKSYEAWSQDQKDSKARESLVDSIHELRKVASRLEIELAVSERDQMTQKPIPIPPHRDAQRRGKETNGNDSKNDRDGGGSNRKPRAGSGQRRSPKKKEASGNS